MQINDGTGRGNVAKVNSDNQLSVDAVVRSVAAFQSASSGESYSVGPAGTNGRVTVTTTGGPMVHLDNTSTVRSIVVDQVTIGSDTADLIYISEIGKTFSSLGNNEDGEVVNLSSNSNKASSVTANAWDQVGDGITGLAEGAVATRALVGVGATNLDAGGSVIIGPGSAFTVSLQSLGAGTIDATVAIRFYEATL